MTTCKVVLADDHQFLLEGILTLLKDDPMIEIVATANNGIELMSIVGRERPGLVIMDLNMPGYDGLQCLQKIKKEFPETRVLILTNYNQPELVDEVRAGQADGYLVKNSTAADLREAVSRIMDGEKYFPDAHMLKSVPDDSFFFDEFLRKYQLTKREIEIIRLICREMSTRQIATALFLSELTINTHRRNILRKLEVKNVAGLMNFAKQNQLL
jgi:DNA-binding NarL/FixJ family response regulator